MAQVAIKSFNTAGAPAAAEAGFLSEVRTAQLASATCQRVCRLPGCCEPDGKICLVMSLYPSSAANLLSNSQGVARLLLLTLLSCHALSFCMPLCFKVSTVSAYSSHQLTRLLQDQAASNSLSSKGEQYHVVAQGHWS